MNAETTAIQADECYGLVQRAGRLDTIDRTRVVTPAVLDGADYDRDDFVERAGDHFQGTDAEPDDTEQYTDAIAVTLTAGELQHLTTQLDEELQSLFENATLGREDV